MAKKETVNSKDLYQVDLAEDAEAAGKIKSKLQKDGYAIVAEEPTTLSDGSTKIRIVGKLTGNNALQTDLA